VASGSIFQHYLMIVISDVIESEVSAAAKAAQLPKEKGIGAREREAGGAQCPFPEVEPGVVDADPRRYIAAKADLRHHRSHRPVEIDDARPGRRLVCALHLPRRRERLALDANTLFDRLDDPTRDYAVHASKKPLLVSSRRKTMGVSYTALCAFFVRSSTKPGEDEIDELVRAACRLWKLPAFVYAGANSRLPKLPGTPLPARLRRPILVQLRDTRADAHDIHFDRFQSIDSDFA